MVPYNYLDNIMNFKDFILIFFFLKCAKCSQTLLCYLNLESL